MKFIRSIFRFFFIIFVILSFTIGGFYLWAYDKYTVPIVTYHNVNYPDHLRLNSVTPESFKRQMAYLKEHGFHVLSFSEFVEATKNKRSFPRKSVVITFDDGYEDNYVYAFPILKQYQFPTIIFICSDFIGEEGYLTWQQIREMEQSDIMIGSHTSSHTYLPEAPSDKQDSEIYDSKRIIEQQLRHRVDFFAYPHGGFNENIKKKVRQAGYLAAGTTNRGFDRFNKDLYEIKRFRLNDSDTSSIVLWGKLSGYYNLFRKLKSPD